MKKIRNLLLAMIMIFNVIIPCTVYAETGAI